MPDISETLKRAAEILQNSGISQPRREAVSLLTFALQKDRTFLIAHAEYELKPAEEKRFWELVQRRAAHEPFQYITGKQEFYGLDFEVTPDVLIPRPETELIVEAAIAILGKKENPRFCEIGVGSGCISISILYHVKTAGAAGLDLSDNALQITKKNAANHGVLDRLDLKISDVFGGLENDKFDLIVSNPPYVPSEDFATLQAEVRDFEPYIALTDGKNGLSIIEKIILASPLYLKPSGSLLMEIGFSQSNAVREMFDRKIWRLLEFFPDLQGIPRMVKAQI